MERRKFLKMFGAGIGGAVVAPFAVKGLVDEAEAVELPPAPPPPAPVGDWNVTEIIDDLVTHYEFELLSVPDRKVLRRMKLERGESMTLFTNHTGCYYVRSRAILKTRGRNERSPWQYAGYGSDPRGRVFSVVDGDFTVVCP